MFEEFSKKENSVKTVTRFELNTRRHIAEEYFITTAVRASHLGFLLFAVTGINHVNITRGYN
jgi:hypothetical protein